MTERLTAADLDVLRLGQGPPVVLVHGSIVDARRTWRHQLVLAEHWSLCLPNRPGFAGSPPLERGDFEAEAPLIAELLGDGAHLVGHSYGAVIALLAAAQRPEAVRSLTVSEPGSLRVAAGDPVVDATIAQGEELYRHRAEIPPEDFLRLFRVGAALGARDARRPARMAGARRAACDGGAPAVGGRHPARPRWPRRRFPSSSSRGTTRRRSRGCATCWPSVSGARREVIAGRGHTIPATGAPYNECLQDFLTACSQETPRDPG